MNPKSANELLVLIAAYGFLLVPFYMLVLKIHKVTSGLGLRAAYLALWHTGFLVLFAVLLGFVVQGLGLLIALVPALLGMAFMLRHFVKMPYIAALAYVLGNNLLAGFVSVILMQFVFR